MVVFTTNITIKHFNINFNTTLVFYFHFA